MGKKDPEKDEVHRLYVGKHREDKPEKSQKELQEENEKKRKTRGF